MSGSANSTSIVGGSRMTARERRALERMIGVLCLVVLVGFLLASDHITESAIARRLRKTGQSVQAVVVRKEATSSGSGRDLCYITYAYRAPQGTAHGSPVASFKNKDEVSDGVFDSVREGQLVAAVYDRLNPSVSELASSLRFPRSPTWLLWIWWAGGGVSVGLLFYQYCLSRKGQSNSSRKPNC